MGCVWVFVWVLMGCVLVFVSFEWVLVSFEKGLLSFGFMEGSGTFLWASIACSVSESARDNMKGLLSLGFMRVLKRPAFLPFGLYRLRFMKVLEVYVGFNVF